mgnify:CR=1 FL=1
MEKLAKHLYEAYCEHTGGKSAVTGHPLPKWDDVAPAVRDAWHATAKAAAAFSADDDDGLTVPPPPGPKKP